MRRVTRIDTDYLKRVKLCLLCVFSLWLTFAPASSVGNSRADNECVKCHTMAEGRAAEVVDLHRAGAHGKAGVNCDGCHGGDPAQSDKARAHAGNFNGKPDANMTLAMCGNCHQPQLVQFKKSRHFPERSGIPRIDCAECHGAHSIGNPPEGFSLTQFCASCHGLEYLPALPQPFQDLLVLSDELREGISRLSAKGLNPSDEIIKQRWEIRRFTAEIIHPTDREGGLKRIPQILSNGEKLKQRIGERN